MSTLFISPARSRQVIAAIVAFALVSVFVIRTSDAAFTADTTNPDNLFRTAIIDLETEETTPLFGEGPGATTDPSIAKAVDLIPGDVIDGCLDVEYAGPDALGLDEVTFDVDITNDDDLLAGALDVAVARVDNCTDKNVDTGVVSDSLAALDSAAAVDTGWTPTTDGETQSFLFTVTVSSGLDEGDMNKTVTGVDLIWSVTTNATS